MPSVHPLVDRFARAGLPLEVLAEPLVAGGGAEAVVQLDITRGRGALRGDERYRLWRGGDENRVEVCAVDRERSQLVLLVKESARRFVVELSRFGRLPPNAQVVREDRRHRWVLQTSPEQKRHFLCGHDEQHLFLAQLPRAASTVRDAHELLRPALVVRAERAAPEATVRQGEWFFVALPPGELRVVEQEAARFGAPLSRSRGLASALGLFRGGRPHVADEVLVRSSGWGAPAAVFARGRVRHPDHATVEFRAWRRVFINGETTAQLPGMTWAD